MDRLNKRKFVNKTKKKKKITNNKCIMVFHLYGFLIQYKKNTFYENECKSITCHLKQFLLFVFFTTDCSRFFLFTSHNGLMYGKDKTVIKALVLLNSWKTISANTPWCLHRHTHSYRHHSFHFDVNKPQPQIAFISIETANK